MPQFFHTDEAHPVLPIFSQAVISRGLIYLSGNIGCTQELKLVEGGIKEQTRAAMENISRILKAANSGMEHIIKVNVYMTNMPVDFHPSNEVYAEFFQAGRMPARTCVGVTHLPIGASIEIECVAEIPERS
jgi:2-iminobutanoate/2-iminopropanoate deaminase